MSLIQMNMNTAAHTMHFVVLVPVVVAVGCGIAQFSGASVCLPVRQVHARANLIR